MNRESGRGRRGRTRDAELCEEALKLADDEVLVFGDEVRLHGRHQPLHRRGLQVLVHAILLFQNAIFDLGRGGGLYLNGVLGRDGGTFLM